MSQAGGERMHAMKWRLLAILGTAVVIYIIVGGVVFNILEEKNEISQRQQIVSYQMALLANSSCLTSGALSDLIKAVTEHVIANNMETYTPSSDKNQSMTAFQWDIFNSIFFSATVVTTIGYGNLVPATVEGKLFCLGYSILGIPLTLVFLGGLGHRFYLAGRRGVDRITLESRRGMRCLLRILTVWCCGLVLLMLLPAALFSYLEHWDFFTAFYYCFISLSTIGFGDYLIGTETSIPVRGWYRLGVSVWLLMGVAWYSAVVAALQRQISELDNSVKTLSDNVRSLRLKRQQSSQKFRLDESRNAEGHDEINTGNGQVSRANCDDPGETDNACSPSEIDEIHFIGGNLQAT